LLLNGSAPLSESEDDEGNSDDDDDAAEEAMLTEAARLSAQARAQAAAAGGTGMGTGTGTGGGGGGGGGGHTRFLPQDHEDALPRPPVMIMGSLSGSALGALRCAHK